MKRLILLTLLLSGFAIAGGHSALASESEATAPEKDVISENLENVDTEITDATEENLKDLKKDGEDALDDTVDDIFSDLEDADTPEDLADALEDLPDTIEGLPGNLTNDAQDLLKDAAVGHLDNAKDLVSDKFSDISKDVVGSIKDQFKNQFNSLFGGVAGLFKGAEDVNEQILDAPPPDWDTVKVAVESANTAGKQLGQQLENRSSDSYHGVRDESESLQRELIAESVARSTTSLEAQKDTVETIARVEGILERSGDLSQNSAATDVSQQILQNISEQNGINTQLLGVISSQNIQAQRDRSNQINLALQSARHASIGNNRARREAILAGEYGSSAWGVIGAPIFLYEETP